MASTYKGIGVALAPDAIKSLEEFAEANGITRAEAIRTSVNIGLPMLRLGIRVNADRALTILEHTQLALSLLVERQYPEDVEELVKLAVANMREHHA